MYNMNKRREASLKRINLFILMTSLQAKLKPITSLSRGNGESLINAGLHFQLNLNYFWHWGT